MQLARSAVPLAEAPFSNKFSTTFAAKSISARLTTALKKSIDLFDPANLLWNFFIFFGSTVAALRHPYRHRGAHARAGPSTAGASNQAALPAGDDGSGNPKESKSRKRKRRGKGKGRGKANSDEDPESTDVPPDADDTKPRMACPFWRFNPIRYFACGSHALMDYEAVRIHIKRKHEGPSAFYCPRCFSFFDNETDKNLHIRRAGVDRCTPAPGHDEITAADWEKAKSRPCPRTSDCATKWMWLWDTFFGRLPRPSPYYRHDIVTETKYALIDAMLIQTVIKNRLPYYRQLDQAETSMLAAEIREALVHTNSGSGLYRVYDDDSGQQTFVDPETHLVQPPGAQADDPAIEDAELLRPIAEHLALPSQIPSLRPGALSSSQILFQSDEPEANSAAFLHPVLITVTDSGMVDEALAKLSRTPLSPADPTGPHWGAAIDYIDWQALNQSRASGDNPPQVGICIPILPSCVTSFRQLMSNVEMPADPHLAHGEGAGEPNVSRWSR